MRKANQNEEDANHMVSLTQLQEVPPKNLILLVGPPGSGKSTFCQQAVLKSLTMDKPVIYVTTQYGPFRAEQFLKERGLGVIEPGFLTYIDAYNESIGRSVSDRPDTVGADCGNLVSMGIAISKLKRRIGKNDILLVLDSLTSPYLLSGSAVVRFLRLTLSKFAAEGNGVLASFDEGSSKKEDLVAMMSLSNGVIKMELRKGKKVLNVVKHPKLKPKRIEFPSAEGEKKELWDSKFFDQKMCKGWWETIGGRASTPLRSEVNDYVNVFWSNLMVWSGIIWDPQRFPTMRYELIKKSGSQIKDWFKSAPWHKRLAFRLRPKSLSKVKDMKKAVKNEVSTYEKEHSGLIEYLEDVSRTDEHYIRVYENFECSVFENIGTSMAAMGPPLTAGMCIGVENDERDWNAIETKCIGLGDSYCEVKLVPGKIDELRNSLEKDTSLIQKIHDRLIDRLTSFLLEKKPLIKRPKLGSDIYFQTFSHASALPAIAGERYRMATCMGGAKMGKKVGEHLTDAGLGREESVKHILNFLEHCKVGKVTLNETLMITENCEGLQIKNWTTKMKEPSCFFTTGFLNGFFYSVTNQHIKEIKCIGMGDPYCEWEFR